MFAAQRLVIPFILIAYFLPAHTVQKKNVLSISQQEANAIGQRIWQNECNKSIAGLTSWNKNESFPSLGIGHFIWFPRDCTAPFTQTFPSLLTFFKKHGVALPTWLEKTRAYCPWNSHDEFMAAANSERMQELRTLLSSTIDLQVLFIIERMQNALPAMVKNKSRKEKRHIQKQFYRVAQTPNGLYVLIDYINFKGEGTNIKERYNGYGWGLLQVLETMKDDLHKNAVVSFADAAGDVLRRRIENAPNKEVEQRFLPGWLNRVNTYTH